ncbi:MAG: septum formation protein Maf [Eubacterium sp.]|nr:septum formation protein Maf [Eubacterium sp.]
MKQNVVIILASGSPRRRELLTQAGLEFQVITSDVEEKTQFTKPWDVVLDLAKQKCDAVAAGFVGDSNYETLKLLLAENTGILIVSADTVVSMDETILGKPADAKDALRSLMSLSGRQHEVYTGVYCKVLQYSSFQDALLEADSFGFSSKTEVNMYPFDEYEALDYIATGEPMDKAGSYGIQGIGERLVESINGDYNNVVGFPLSRFMKELAEREYIVY